MFRCRILTLMSRVFSRTSRSLLLLLLALLATIGAIFLTWIDRVVWHRGDIILGGYVVLLAVLLPARSACALLVSAGAVFAALRHISFTKSALTLMPLTSLDLKFAIADPASFTMALGWPPWSSSVILACEVGIACVVGWQGIRFLRFARAEPRHACESLLAAAGIAVLCVVFASAQARLVARKVGEFRGLWRLGSLPSLSHEVGFLTFLIYTHGLEQRDRAMFFSRVASQPMSRSEIDAEVNRYIPRASGSLPTLPNIILVHLESTFDPNTVFDLTSPVVNTLLNPSSPTRLTRRLRVNVVGGGSSVTEFEGTDRH